MTSKILIILVLCVFLYVGYGLINDNQKINNEKNISELLIDQKPKTLEPKDQVIKQPLSKEQEIDEWTKTKATTTIKDLPKPEFNIEAYDPLFEELSDTRYSTDPIEEFFSISRELRNCRVSSRYLINIEPGEKWYKELKLKHKKTCSQLESIYPEIKSFRSDKQVRELFLNNAFNSPFAELFKRIMMKEKGPQIENAIINSFLKSKNAQMIKLLADFPSSYKITQITDEVSLALNVENQHYIQLITKQALEVFACQFNNGVTCKSDGVFMLRKCHLQNQLCGKDTLYWFTEYISKNHKKDLEIVIGILQNISSSLSEKRKSTAEKLDLVLLSPDFR